MAETKEKTQQKPRKTGCNNQPSANDAIKYRAYPTDEQYQKIAQNIGSARYYWNLIIDIARITYEQQGHSITVKPAEAKRWNECNFLADADSLALANVERNYRQAWKNHKKDPKQYHQPTYKKRNGLSGSYTTNNQPKWDKKQQKYITPGTIQVKDGTITLPKIGAIPIRQHTPLPDGAVIKNVTVTRDCTGKIFVSIGYYNPELDELLKQAGLDTTKDQVIITGLDYSNPYLFVSENGYSPKDVHYYKKSQEKLARLQRKLSRRVKGSSNYKKLQLRIARLHRKIANQRLDLLHKLSYELASKCDVVCVESLDLKAISKRKKGRKFSFGKSVNDNAWGKFLTILEYKLERQGGQLVKIDKFFPSSKTCHHCGTVLKDLELSIREWECPTCGTHHDRDVNAAWNILLEGVRMLRAGEIESVGTLGSANFCCAGGAPVTASTLRAGGALASSVLGGGVLPVEECKSVMRVGGLWDHLVLNTNLHYGSSDQREAGKKKDCEARLAI